jgi:hypothetical protein
MVKFKTDDPLALKNEIAAGAFVYFSEKYGRQLITCTRKDLERPVYPACPASCAVAWPSHATQPTSISVELFAFTLASGCLILPGGGSLQATSYVNHGAQAAPLQEGQECGWQASSALANISGTIYTTGNCSGTPGAFGDAVTFLLNLRTPLGYFNINHWGASAWPINFPLPPPDESDIITLANPNDADFGTSPLVGGYATLTPSWD